MNKIIWKGIDSSTISGLIISELPPISKPQMRTNITEIDGLDGDIVEELGYKSYTKSLTISLSYDFDIDEVIKYFSGTGTLILSNESDKYYNAQIVKSIDYERLLRFRTATISFYVQPYKYLVDEEIASLEVLTEEETSLSVTNQGLEESKPIIILYGSGTIVVAVNDVDMFSIELDEEYIVIDSTQEEAYYGSTLKNRNMIGEFPTLSSGENIISWTGNLTKITVDPKSRWL